MRVTFGLFTAKIHGPPKISLANRGDGLLSQRIAKRGILLWQCALNPRLKHVLRRRKLVQELVNGCILSEGIGSKNEPQNNRDARNDRKRKGHFGFYQVIVPVALLKVILPPGHCQKSRRMPLACLRMIIAAALILIVNQAGAACVWKVTSGTNVLYLGGSIHALKNSDYPLPVAYNRALDASDRLVFEVDPKALLQSSRGIL